MFVRRRRVGMRKVSAVGFKRRRWRGSKEDNDVRRNKVNLSQLRPSVEEWISYWKGNVHAEMLKVHAADNTVTVIGSSWSAFRWEEVRRVGLIAGDGARVHGSFPRCFCLRPSQAEPRFTRAGATQVWRLTATAGWRDNGGPLASLAPSQNGLTHSPGSSRCGEL